MSDVKEGLKYSKEHEWVEVLEGNVVRVGITAFAQHELGDIVFVELPAVDDEVAADQSMGTVESVKSVSDVYAPVGGKIIKVNSNLEDAPETINEDPYAAGWMVEMELNDPAELEKLLSAEQYLAFIEGE